MNRMSFFSSRKLSLALLLGVFTTFMLLTPAALAKKTAHKKAPPPPEINIPVSGFSNDPGMASFERQFIPFLKKWRVPGASMTVIKNNQVIAMRGYGWADKDTKEMMAPESLFRIASVSKTFTAVTVLKLIQDGKLRLDDSVFHILSDLKPLNQREINPRIYQITVQNLLQMSSGWFSTGGHFDPMFGPWPKQVSDVLSPELPASCETTARFMMSQPLRHRPGTNYSYSNLDYCILGLVINKVTGQPYGYSGYEHYVRDNILAPLGIRNMQIGSTQLQYRVPGEAKYYRDPRSTSAEELANSSYLPYSSDEILRKNFANGGWIATSKDLAMFLQALNQGRILNEQSLRLMQQKPVFASKDKTTYYTMGGIISNLDKERYWIQTGSFTGTNAMILTKPNGTTIAVIFNYRPDTYSFLARFRPELRRLLINSDL